METIELIRTMIQERGLEDKILTTVNKRGDLLVMNHDQNNRIYRFDNSDIKNEDIARFSLDISLKAISRCV